MTVPTGDPNRRRVLQSGGVAVAPLVAGGTWAPQRYLGPSCLKPTSAGPALAAVRSAARPRLRAALGQLSAPLLRPGVAGHSAAARPVVHLQAVGDAGPGRAVGGGGRDLGRLADLRQRRRPLDRRLRDG